MQKHLASVAGLLLLGTQSGAIAATGGGATIHNAATLAFNGGEVTAHVDVEVLTIGSAPTFDAVSQSVNAGDTVDITYTITSNSNGSDTYDLSVSTNDANVSAPTALSVSPPQLVLGASITSRPSTAGTIYVPAGSGTDIVSGDTIRITLGGTDYQYQVNAVTSGTPAYTVGNSTTAEVPTAITLAPIGAAPSISAGNVPVGSQIGEVRTVVVSLTAGTPTTPGSAGSHEIVIDGAAATPGPGGPGDVISFTDVATATVSVLSGTATLLKEVRNVTQGGGFASSGISARSGDVLEYRLSASPVPGETVTGAVLTDSIPEYTTYVANSTTLNGALVADVAGDSPVVAGLSVNSPGAAAGEIPDGESAVVTFQVTVE